MRRAPVFAQLIARQAFHQHFQHVADTAELATVGADVLQNIGPDLRRAGATEVDGEKAELMAHHLRLHDHGLVVRGGGLAWLEKHYIRKNTGW
jgi:hypothetical protein